MKKCQKQIVRGVEPTIRDGVPTKRGISYLNTVELKSRAHEKRGCAHSPQREGGLTSVQSGCRVEPTTREGVPTERRMFYLSAVELQSRANEKRRCAHKEREV